MGVIGRGRDTQQAARQRGRPKDRMQKAGRRENVRVRENGELVCFMSPDVL